MAVNIAKFKRHGMCYDKIYNTWRGMKSRCANKNSRNYGGKGIKVCEEWSKSFVVFRDWALNNGWVHGMNIDRIDSNGDYCPENCRIVTPKVNSENRNVTMFVKYNGSLVPFRKVIRELGINERNITAIWRRIERGWDHQLAIDTPIRKGNYRCGKK